MCAYLAQRNYNHHDYDHPRPKIHHHSQILHEYFVRDVTLQMVPLIPNAHLQYA